MSYTIIDKQDRSKLAEGRGHGLGFALGKLEGNTVTTVMPISPCRDYLNDVVYSEYTGKPFGAWGLKTKKEGIFEGYGYMAMKVCLMGARNGTEYPEYKKDLKSMDNNYLQIQNMINWFEEMFKAEGRSIIHKVEDNLYLAVFPPFWHKGTYRISLLSLLIRCAMEFTGGDVMKFLNAYRGEDYGNLKGNAMRKIQLMLAGNIPEQDMNKGFQGHSHGICSHKFP